MTTTIQPAVAGDVGDTRLCRLDGVADLVSATAVEAHVWNDSAQVVTLAASVTDTAARTVTVELGGSGGWLEAASPGIYNFEIEVTFGNNVLTWPNANPATLRVRTAR